MFFTVLPTFLYLLSNVSYDGDVQLDNV